LLCGDLGVTTTLSNTTTNDTLSAVDGTPAYKGIDFPVPVLTMAVAPQAKGDEDKISQGIAKLLEEDRTLKYQNNPETKQMLISGLGEMHLDVIKSKLKSRFQISVELVPEKIAYRETIRKSVKVQGKHKKQSGGHGQYGDVWIEFSPGNEEGLEFTESIVGGTVPKNFHPAVEKGLLESMTKGILAGYPVVRLKANLYDGSYHDVDSSEMSFKIAANLAFKEGMRQASPVLLEPVGVLKVFIPNSLMGDVFGDITKRRGRVLGTAADERKKEYSIVEAEVPKAEMGNYAVTLRAMSQGRARYTFEVTSYSEVPESVAAKVIEEAKRNAEE
ncbi:MAG: elongation factor G, partial [Clostridia bacterium]|nr:elongation factor G [Clostridia bacterium]